MKVEELRKVLIEAIKSMSNYTDRELVEVQCIGDKLKEMASYESFLRDRDVTKDDVSDMIARCETLDELKEELTDYFELED